jgi:hypothetical protein
MSPPFLKKEAIINTVKRSYYVRGSESREAAKEAAYIYCHNFTNYYFYC